MTTQRKDGEAIVTSNARDKVPVKMIAALEVGQIRREEGTGIFTVRQIDREAGLVLVEWANRFRRFQETWMPVARADQSAIASHDAMVPRSDDV